ncbi:MAG TPA: sigma-70 family RNA polymerase sigma factor [Edaphocola sp.]|nr:sigma-70 family RNA polymerase sigma factor [Edaphocola sp.]
MNQKHFYTDEELLKGLSNSESHAIEEIYKLYQPMVLTWLTTRGGDEDDAYDVFQEGLMVLYEKSKDSTFSLSSKISTYLLAVCKRIWFKKTQQRGHVSSFEENLKTDDDEGTQSGIEFGQYDEDLQLHLEKEADFEKLEDALNVLGSPCNQLLKAFYIEDKNMQEIAIQFDYTNAENAKTQKYKCLNRLKKIFFSSKVLLKD